MVGVPAEQKSEITSGPMDLITLKRAAKSITNLTDYVKCNNGDLHSISGGTGKGHQILPGLTGRRPKLTGKDRNIL